MTSQRETRESQQYERTSRRACKLACYECSFQNYGIPCYVNWIFDSINNKNMQGLATQQVPSKDYTTLNKGSQRLVCSITSLSTSEHSHLKVAHSTRILTNRKQIYSSFLNIFCGNQKKCYIPENVNLRETREALCWTFPQNSSL